MALTLKSLLERRVPQILGVYLGGSWASIELVGWLMDRLSLGAVWVDATAALLFSLLPAVVLIAYTHGRKGHQTIPTYEAIFVPANLLFSGFLVFTIFNEPEVPVVRVEPGTSVRRQMTFTGNAHDPGFSPDGTRFAFVSSDSLGSALLVRPLEGDAPPDTLLVAGAIRRVRWPTNEFLIAWLRGEDYAEPGTYRIDTETGQTTYVGRWPFYAAAPDGSRLAHTNAPREAVFVTESEDEGEGKETEFEIVGAGEWTRELVWAPRAPVVLVSREGVGGALLLGLNVDTGEQWEYATSRWLHSPQFSPKGDALYYVAPASEPPRRRTLFRLPLEAETARPTAPPEALAPVPDSGRVSPDGESFLHRASANRTSVRSFDLSDPSRLSYSDGRVLAENASAWGRVTVRPDGSAVAHYDGAGSLRIHYPDGEASDRFPWPFERWSGRFPYEMAWDPSGEGLTLSIGDGSTGALLLRIPLGESLEGTLLASPVSNHVAWCGADRILSQDIGNQDYSILDSSGELRGKVFGDRAMGWMFDPVCSPDGSEVVFRYNHQDGPGLWVVNLETQVERLLVESEDQSRPAPVGWSPDGAWVFFLKLRVPPIGLFRVSASGGDPQQLLDLPASTAEGAMAADASLLVTIESHSQTDLWLMENLRAGGGY